MLCPFSPTLWKSQQNRKLHNKQLKTVISKLYNEGVQTDVLPQWTKASTRANTPSWGRALALAGM